MGKGRGGGEGGGTALGVRRKEERREEKKGSDFHQILFDYRPPSREVEKRFFFFISFFKNYFLICRLQFYHRNGCFNGK